MPRIRGEQDKYTACVLDGAACVLGGRGSKQTNEYLHNVISGTDKYCERIKSRVKELVTVVRKAF